MQKIAAFIVGGQFTGENNFNRILNILGDIFKPLQIVQNSQWPFVFDKTPGPTKQEMLRFPVDTGFLLNILEEILFADGMTDQIFNNIPGTNVNTISNGDHGMIGPNFGGFSGMDLADSVDFSGQTERKDGHGKGGR